jgi:hypothetical protein
MDVLHDPLPTDEILDYANRIDFIHNLVWALMGRQKLVASVIGEG